MGLPLLGIRMGLGSYVSSLLSKPGSSQSCESSEPDSQLDSVGGHWMKTQLEGTAVCSLGF